MRETRDQMNKHRGKITEKKAETKAKRIKEKEKETKKIMDQINDQAKDLYDRFIRGEKLSTEDVQDSSGIQLPLIFFPLFIFVFLPFLTPYHV